MLPKLRSEFHPVAACRNQPDEADDRHLLVSLGDVHPGIPDVADKDEAAQRRADQVVDVVVVLLGVGTQGEPEDQFGRRMLRAVLVGAGIARFPVFAVDPAVTVGIGVEGVGAVVQFVGVGQAVVVRVEAGSLPNPSRYPSPS